MTDLAYKKVMQDLKKRILKKSFDNDKLPNEQRLSEEYHVSRSSAKRALDALVEQGIIFKRKGLGAFVNSFYLRKRSVFHYDGTILGVTDSLSLEDSHYKIKILEYKVVPASYELQQELFLNSSDFVYQIKRLLIIDDNPTIIDTGFIPIKLLPSLTPDIVRSSRFNYLDNFQGKTVNKSFLSTLTEPSNSEDQVLLELSNTEPVGIIEGILFLDDGTPFEVSSMRMHYKYLNYSTFIKLDQD